MGEFCQRLVKLSSKVSRFVDESGVAMRAARDNKALGIEVVPQEKERAARLTRAVLRGAERICYPVRCMDNLTEDDIRKIERIHSRWIEFEVAGKGSRLLTLCSDNIEFWPPNAQPLLGRTAVSAQLERGATRIHCIEINSRRIRGLNDIAYLTANYKTTFSSAEDCTPRQALGSHLWILQKWAGSWLVTLVSWSLWG